MANQFGIKIRQLREEEKLLQKQVADQLHMDSPMLSKIESGDRKAKKEQVALFADALHADPEELLTLWLADHLLDVVAGEQLGLKAITLAGAHITDLLKDKLTLVNGL
ncbi:helix-turn-helix transcriptional regulator [Mucilaginibacter mali]|uniref:Helix-turn-helix transcriptional regulator n=1 Tax=Mucilaginibacter mali TaxID=2740462 RepID=A0A7D4QNY6_9SPHI|nr:helix-turn-helix transcriptional regulator [Mucilaginibacter mali]QKJ32870.1 helix-turn-helix transcriptional regulator [Mucilaginibacter mali]